VDEPFFDSLTLGGFERSFHKGLKSQATRSYQALVKARDGPQADQTWLALLAGAGTKHCWPMSCRKRSAVSGKAGQRLLGQEERGRRDNAQQEAIDLGG
jgi:hypothetical protein